MRPTPEQARELLQTRPDLVAQLRAYIQSSGLTPDQIRARLRAAGYPDDLLDPYLTGADTTSAFALAPNTLEAVRSLGLLSPAALDSLERLRAQPESIGPRAEAARRDSLADSTSVPAGQLKLFGSDVFRRATTRFQAVQAGPVDESYRLGPGDVLVLILTGDVQQTYTLEVNREGFVLIPQVGQVFVANLTLGQLEDQLYTRLGRVYSGVRRGPNARTRFSVTVSRLRNIQVFVIGDVIRPGSYQISAASTVLTGLYVAGGPTDNGSFRRVEVRRGNKLLDSIDVYDYLLRGINRSDLRLQTGDVVFVPVHGGLVKVGGQVLRPAIYEVKPSETLRDVVQAAGGLAVNAEARVQIHRILPPAARGPEGRDRVVIDLAEDQFAGDAIPAFPVVAGDSIRVYAAPGRLRDFVTVRGNVFIEGRVGFNPGMKLSEAIRLAGGPKPDVYLGEILISRVRSDSSKVQLRSAFADSTGKVVTDLALDREDEIRVFSRATFRTEPYVTVVGAVRHSGRIPYREGMTLRDAVLLADGLTEDASLDQAEIARLSPNRPTGALAQTIRVPLDSGYLFRGGAPSGERGAPGGNSGSADPPVLEPYDNVLILRQPGWELQRLVAVTGQVKYPGRYALTSKTERIADLVSRAGGLTSEAYPGGVQFYRRAQTSRFDLRGVPTDTSRVVQPLPPGFKERVGVDLPRALKDSGSRENLLVSAGDSIHIPEYNPIVVVQGAVNSPGPVAYAPGKNLDWYVNSAGGYGSNGDRKRAYVTQPDGKKEGVARRFLLGDDVPRPGPGAVVFVPQRAAAGEPSNLPAVLGVLGSVLASLTTVIVVLRR